MPKNINPNSDNQPKQGEGSAPDWPGLDTTEVTPVTVPAAKSKIKPSPKPKPLVEGINAPKNTNDIVFVKPALTAREKKLISETGIHGEESAASGPKQLKKNQEPRLLPNSVVERMNNKPSRVMRWITALVVILILIIGGYEGYVWYLNKSVAALQINQQAQSSGSLNSGNFADAVNYDTATSTLLESTTTPIIATSTPVIATATPPVIVTKLKINPTPTGYLNVRSGPASSYGITTTVSPGQIFTYTNSQNGWYEILLTGGKSGWVSGQYVTVQ